MLEGNKLIAEFMQLKFSNDKWYRWDDVNKGSGYFIKLKYHSSWDWLMPVVEKIIDIDITPAPNWTGYRIEIVPRGYVKISGVFPMAPIFKNVSIEGSLIKATWLAVVEFIKWHNENK